MFSRLLLSFVGSVLPLFCREHSLFLHLPADRSLPDPAFGLFPNTSCKNTVNQALQPDKEQPAPIFSPCPMRPVGNGRGLALP